GRAEGLYSRRAGRLVVFEEETQVLYGTLGVLAELRDIATQRLRRAAKQTVKGIKQNALPDGQDFNDVSDRGGEPKHQNTKHGQRAMSLSTDAHGKVSHSPSVQVQRAKDNRNEQQEQQVREREQKKCEKQLLDKKDAKSENGEQESARANQRAPFSHGPLSLRNPPVIGCRKRRFRNTKQ